MPQPRPPRSSVLRGALIGKTPPAVLTACDAICAAGAQCPQVAASPIASLALASLKTAIDQFRTSHTQRLALGTALKVQIGVAHKDELGVRSVLGTYMSTINVIADGDPTLIANAGLKSRADKPVALVLGVPAGLAFLPGKKAAQAIVHWKACPGAASYVLEVNFTPNTPGSAWVALVPGRSRRRTVVAPAPGAQFLLRLASVGGDAQSDWSSPLMVTAR